MWSIRLLARDVVVVAPLLVATLHDVLTRRDNSTTLQLSTTANGSHELHEGARSLPVTR